VSSSANSDALDQLWPRYAELHPQLRSHVSVIAQTYRGQLWYVLHNAINGKHLRINESAYAFVARLRGDESVDHIVNTLSEQQAMRSITRSEAVLLLVQLQQQGGLLNGLELDSKQLLYAGHAHKARLKRHRFLSPLAQRFALFDPDDLLDRMYPRVKGLLSGSAFLIYLLIVFVALLAAYMNWGVISREFHSQALSPSFVLLLWLVYPAMKVVHEMAHALIIKRGGGEVHEMGITLLVFTPVPYVDASAAWLFKSRRLRMMVSGVGIVAELVLASLALFFWLVAEAGMLREIAFAVMLVGSFSTLAFNANPLLKFDGYYMLQDFLEIPNLYHRAQQYLLYCAKRYLLRVESAGSPVLAEGERKWFVVFGIASLVYRNVIMLIIALWLLSKLLVIGLVIFLWVVIVQYVMPVLRFLKYILNSEDMRQRRWMHSMAPALAFSLLVLFLVRFPMPHSSPVPGIVWVADQAQLYAAGSGTVVEVFAEPGQMLSRGDPVLQLSHPELEANIAVLQAQLTALQVRREAQAADLELRMIPAKDDLNALKVELALARQRMQALYVEAPVSGRFATVSEGQLMGRYFKQGEMIGHIVDPSQLIVKAVIPEHRVGLFNAQAASVTVRLAERLDQPVTATLMRQTPSASNLLPSPALGTAGGGGIAIAAGDSSGVETVERVFHLELALAETTKVTGIGERAFVRVQHDPTPLASRFLKSTRQLFLRHLPDYAG